MKLPKIFIFTPIAEHKEYCLPAFIENCKKFTYPNFTHVFVDNSTSQKFVRKLADFYDVDAYWVQRGNNSREALTRSQNFARKKFLESDATYFLSLESDIFPPADFMERLLTHTKDVVTGLYMIGNQGLRIPCITLPQWSNQLMAYGTRLLLPKETPEYINKGLKKVVAGGMGCCLIYRSVIERIPFYYDPRFQSHSDVYFFNDCFMLHIDVFVDTNTYCEHDNIDWNTVKDR